jgi:hypothetical protein
VKAILGDINIQGQVELLIAVLDVERVAARLLDYLLNIDRVRGTGRLYLP